MSNIIDRFFGIFFPIHPRFACPPWMLFPSHWYHHGGDFRPGLWSTCDTYSTFDGTVASICLVAKGHCRSCIPSKSGRPNIQMTVYWWRQGSCLGTELSCASCSGYGDNLCFEYIKANVGSNHHIQRSKERSENKEERKVGNEEEEEEWSERFSRNRGR